MATIQRLPIGDSAVAWTRSAGSYNFALVDDPIGSPDDDTTYNYSNVGTNQDLFSFLTFGIAAGSTITNVTVRGRFKRMEAGGAEQFRFLAKVNGTVYHGSGESLVLGAYFDRSWTMAVNPNTNLAWTVADVNGTGANPLQAFGYEDIGFQKIKRCTQVYIEVNGTFQPPPTIAKPLMRDVATGKLMKDVATGKLMRAAEAHNCSACFAAGKTPKYYTLTFADVLLCPTRSWPGSVNLNQKWHLQQYDPVALPCYWRYSDANWLIYIQFNVGTPARTWIRAYQPPGDYYFSFHVAEACFINGAAYNMYAVGDCGSNVYGHYGAVLIQQGQV